MNRRTRLWHWVYCKAIDYKYGWGGKKKSPNQEKFWTYVNNGLCRVLDRVGWGSV